LRTYAGAEDLVVVDVETTGTNPFQHQIVSLAMVPLDPNKPPLEVFIATKDPVWHETAARFFEPTRRQWEAEAVQPDEACRVVHEYLAKQYGRTVTPVGHNIGFDVAFLRQLAYRGGLDELPLMSHRALDTHTLLYWSYMRGLVPKKAVTSSGAFEHFGIELSDQRRHTAIGDALATRDLILKLLELSI